MGADICGECDQQRLAVGLSDLLRELVVHLEGPQLQASRQLRDGGESEEELLGAAQRHVRVAQLSLLDPLLLLLSGDHRQDFLQGREGGREGGMKEGWEGRRKSRTG